MKKIYFKVFSLTIVFIVIPMILGSVNAASLKFDKSTATVANGGTVQITVTVDPGSDALSSVDAYVSFDSAVLKASSVTAGALFPTVTHDESTTGKIYIAGMVNDPTVSISTTGTLATITFQGLKEGTANLSFDCNTSKIIKNDINASNVITCSQNGTSVVTVGAGGGSNPTPTPAPGEPTDVPEELPQSGAFDNVIRFAIPGMILLILGSVVRVML